MSGLNIQFVVSFKKMMNSKQSNLLDSFLGEQLRDARMTRGESLNDVIDHISLGITAATLSNLERGNQRFSATQLFTLAKYFGLSIDGMFKKYEQSLRDNKATTDVINQIIVNI